MTSRLRNRISIMIAILAPTFVAGVALVAQTPGNVSLIQSQKKETEKEISQIKGQIGENQKAVTENLATLKRLEGEIEGSQKDIDLAKNHIQTLSGKISSLESSIDIGEGELKKLRGEYLKAVKKMRVARKKNSGMAFIFASKSFAQAERRMRYVKEFSDWKTRQQDAITGQVTKLKNERDELDMARRDKDVAYKRQLAAQDNLKKKQQEQTQVVAQLQANGDKLKAHLAQKQAEARQLAGQISQLIAQEQARDAERRRKDAERKAAEQRHLAEQQQKKAAAEKAAAEKAAAEKAAAEKAAAEKAKTEKTKPTTAKTVKEPSKAKENTPTPQAKETASSKSGQSTATESRRRRRRDTQDNSKETPKATQTSSSPTQPASSSSSANSSTNPSGGSGFGAMKGMLPKPVGGSFRIVSAFGKHPVSPELPDIMYENMGIDAHVSIGASASAVFDGEVMTVYDRSKTPGFRNVVVVKHGEYITVYANLETVAVKEGQKVKQGQTLGAVGTDFDDPKYGLIHFEVWQGQTRQNPAAWIK